MTSRVPPCRLLASPIADTLTSTPGALGAERRQVGGHHDGRDAQRLAADVDAKPLQHRLQGLLGEGDVVERVAGAAEADHQPVAMSWFCRTPSTFARSLTRDAAAAGSPAHAQAIVAATTASAKFSVLIVLCSPLRSDGITNANPVPPGLIS